MLGESQAVSQSATTAVASVEQLGLKAGTVYVGITRNGLESARTAVRFTAEKSLPLESNQITVINNEGTNTDKIEVNDLVAGEKITIYTLETGGKVVASSTVARGKTDVSVATRNLNADGGTLYFAITRSGQPESDRIEVDYSSEK